MSCVGYGAEGKEEEIRKTVNIEEQQIERDDPPYIYNKVDRNNTKALSACNSAAKLIKAKLFFNSI